MRISTRDDDRSRLLGGVSVGTPAGGDTGGTFPSPTVTGIQGVPVDDSAASPSDRDALIYAAALGAWIADHQRAIDVDYDNSGGGTTATNVQAAIEAIIVGALVGIYLTAVGGGRGNVYPLGTLGAAATVDLVNGNAFHGTLDQDCTISTSGWTDLKDCQIRLEIAEDSTGGWTPTIDGVTWIGGTPTWDTTPDTVTHVVLFSRDAGSTIWAVVVGGASLAGLSDVEITSPAVADRLRFDGTVWRNSALRWTPVTVFDGTNWQLLTDGSGNAIMAEA